MTKCCHHRCWLRRSPTVALVLALLGCGEFCTFFSSNLPLRTRRSSERARPINSTCTVLEVKEEWSHDKMGHKQVSEPADARFAIFAAWVGKSYYATRGCGWTLAPQCSYKGEGQMYRSWKLCGVTPYSAVVGRFFRRRCLQPRAPSLWDDDVSVGEAMWRDAVHFCI
jgi:hypothetical protein